MGCEKDGSTTVLTPVVQTTPFGIRVHVRNDTSKSIFIKPFGAALDPGNTDRTITRRPGLLEISCWQYLRAPEPAPGQPMLVTDPGRFWRNPVPECHSIRTVRFGASAPSQSGTPIEVVRRGLTGLRSSDVVERAGYRDRYKGVIRVARGGRTIASVRLTEPGRGVILAAGGGGSAGSPVATRTKRLRWHEASACDDSGIGWDLSERS